MVRFIQTLIGSACLIAAALILATLPTLRALAPVEIAQNITVEYLENLLDELIADGLERPEETICTVNWEEYGIIVRLNCKTRLRAGDAAKLPADPSKQTVNATIEGEARIDCDNPFVRNTSACIERSIELYGANLEAPWRVQANDVCDAVLSVMHVKFAEGPPPCPVDDEFSEIKLQSAPADLQRKGTAGDPTLYIMVSKDGTEPPIFSVEVIATPATLDNMTSDEHFERMDFLLFWTYEQTGEFDVAVEPIFILQGTNRSSIDELIQVKASDRLTRVVGIRQTQARPTVVATAIAAAVRGLTEHIRDTM